LNTTEQDEFETSLYDEFLRNPREALELAAAEVTMKAQGLLEQATLQRPDITQADLAGRLGVTDGRVSQVVNGDGIKNLALLARYMRALGYEIEMFARPVEAGAQELTQSHRAPSHVPAHSPNGRREKAAPEAGISLSHEQEMAQPRRPTTTRIQ
jgi:transcriptional regulator with XRE-family HTH domain